MHIISEIVCVHLGKLQHFAKYLYMENGTLGLKKLMNIELIQYITVYQGPRGNVIYSGIALLN